MSVYDWENTWWDLRDSPPELAILPLGSTEAHGPHLPLGTTSLILDVISRQVAVALVEDVYLLPTMPYGSNPQYADFTGSTALPWRTHLALLTDLVESLRAGGIRRVAILVGLGSASANTTYPTESEIAKTAVRRLNYDHQDLSAIWVQPLTVASPPLSSLVTAAADQVRAGRIVTSLMLHLLPELVRPLPDGPVPAHDTLGQPISIAHTRALPFQAVSPNGVWGRPSEASAELGISALRDIVVGTASYIHETLAQVARLKARPQREERELP